MLSKRECDLVDKGGYTPLLTAIRFGHDDCAVTLMSRLLVAEEGEEGIENERERPVDGDQNQPTCFRRTDKSRRTPLHIAAAYGRTELCRKLIEHGHAICVVDKHQRSPLHVAASKNNFEIVELLLSQAKSKKLSRDQYVDLVDAEGDTAIILAAKKNCKKVVQVLIDYSSDVFIRNLEGKRAVDYCLKNECKTLFEDIMVRMCVYVCVCVCGFRGKLIIVAPICFFITFLQCYFLLFIPFMSTCLFLYAINFNHFICLDYSNTLHCLSQYK